MRPRIPLPAPLDSTPFTRATALDAGLGSNRVDGPDLLRPFHGVRHPIGVPLDFEAHCRAFATTMPPSAFFSSVTAARLRQVPLPLSARQSTVLHVAVPTPHHASAARGVRGHKVQLMGDDAGNVRGLNVSTPARLWCELAAELGLGDLVAAGDYIIHWRWPLCSLNELQQAVARYPGRKGRATLRMALTLLDERSESPRESLLRVMLVIGGISGLQANLTVRVRGMNFRIDLAIPRYKLALEYQGEHHNDPVQWRKDMTKREVLATEGWHTMEINANDLVGTELIERILITIAGRPTFD